MLNIIDLYNQNIEDFIDSLSKDVELTCLKGGTNIQVIYDNETESVKFFNGDLYNTKIGEEIKNIDKLFTNGLKKALDMLSTKTSIIKQYEYILLEVYNDNIYVISVIDKNLKINKDISKVAKILNVKIPEYSFKGKLSKYQKDLILGLVQENTLLGKEEFNGFIKQLFKIDESKNISFKDLLFNLDYLDSHIQVVFSCLSENTDPNKREIKNVQNKDVILKLKECFEGYTTDEDFINLLSDYKTYNKLYNLGTKLNKNEYSICIESLNPEIATFIKKGGSIVKKLYENYVIINYINEKLKISPQNIDIGTYIYTKEYHPEKIMDALDYLFGRRNHNISLDIHNFIKDSGEYKTIFTYESEEDLIKLCAFVELLFGVTMYNGEENNSEDLGHYILNKDIVKNTGDKYQTEIDKIIQDCNDIWINVYNKTLR